MSIHVSSLQKNYGAQKAVNNISFSVQKGQIVGFLGPNGAGKSTTMKILTGYLQADGGKAEVCGRDVRIDPLFTKARIGYLPESNPLYYDMFVREYLHFMASVHRVANANARVKEVISLVGLQPESDKKVGQLSKGYKQRVGLAAALIHQPEVLILDEPTTGLDPNQIVEIREVIRRLGKDKTILFSTHILQEVEAICDRVIIINKGEVIADSSLSDLQNQHSEPLIKVQFRQTIEPEWIRRAIPSITS
ncbi:MAG: ATP-binding cassette domain-containing protein, partial [Flavihumibacter sp.]